MLCFVLELYNIILFTYIQKKIFFITVATGFPTGQYSLETRLKEITFAVDSGATEIDVVIDRSLVLTGQWDLLFEELLQMRKACGKTHMKVILAIGELGTMTNVSCQFKENIIDYCLIECNDVS